MKKQQFPKPLRIAVLATVLLGGCTFNLFPMRGKALEETLLQEGEGEDEEKTVVIVEMDGVISLEDDEPGPLGITGEPSVVARTVEALRRASADKQVKALILQVDSPGGSVTASDIIYHELLRFKEKTNAVVVAVFMDVAASGGYYVALAADHIMAHPTSVTGSIGVILQTADASNLLNEKLGVKMEVIKSGEKKDILSPFRPLTLEERQILQGIVNQLFERFVDVVTKGRPALTREQILEVADGRIFTAEQALKAGLVDQIGYMDNAIVLAKERAGLKNPKVIRYHLPGEYIDNLYSKGAVSLSAESMVPYLLRQMARPRFLYQWIPSLN